MASSSSSSSFCYDHLLHLGFQKTLERSRRISISSASPPPPHGSASALKDLGIISSFDYWDDSEGISGGNGNMLSSSEGEESDGDLLVIPFSEVDLPRAGTRFDQSDAVTAAAHQFASLQRRRRRKRIQPGVFINMGLIVFSVMLLLFVDWCSWKIIRSPLPSLYLTRPFAISAFLASFAGFFFIPLVHSLRVHQILRKEGPSKHHSSKRATPTMGGLFFIPIGVIVSRAIVGFKSIEVYGAAAATLAFAAIGLLDDILSFIKKHNYGLPGRTKLFLQVIVGACFSFWLETTNISSPYSMKTLVPLPPPLGLVCFGKFYLVFTTFCFAAMGNGVNLTDGLDGLAGGTAALAFIGMSIAVLPICSDLAIFGASMAGACVGFLMHNGYKASIFMGDTGSLALGGALAAMAACTGMFFPLFIASGIYILEALSVIMQVFFFKVTKRMYGYGRRLFQMAPLHHHFEVCGLKEPLIVVSAYFVASLLAVFAGYVGLISA